MASEPKYNEIDLDNIIKFLNKEQNHLKGILFLMKYQNGLDADEQKCLLLYNKFFPFKEF